MARRSSKSTDTPTPEAQEGTVTSTTEETPVATEETAPEAATETAAAETPIDLSGFQSAATAAVETRDSSTGDLAEAEFDKVNQAYRALDGAKAKNKAKAWLTDQLTSAMNELDAQKSRAWMLVQEHLSAAGPKASGGTKERTPVDPTEAYVEQVTTLNLARALVQAPEGVGEDAEERANALYSESYGQAEQFRAWFVNEAEDKGDEPEVPAFVKNAVKLSLGRSAKAGGVKKSTGSSPFTGERRSIEKHIAEVFADAPSGTFKSIAEIRKATTAEYGDDHPSAGAISARLFPKSGKVTLPEGITPAQQDGKNGAVKA
jgi:hypothetical protein